MEWSIFSGVKREVSIDVCFMNNSYLYLFVSIPWMPWEREFWSERARIEAQKKLEEED